MKMNRLILIIVAIIVTNHYSKAIPAFARKYNISCMTCHAPSLPKLKPYGDEFAGDGFKLDDYEAPRYYTETGDKKLSLIRDFPIAVRMDGYVQTRIDETGRFDWSAPYLIKLLSGGELSEHFAYYFYFYMDEHGEVAGVEDAYIMYDRLFNTDIDVYFGQFQVSDPLFKRELRLTFEDYHLYTSKIGLSDMTMKYDRGVMMTYGLPTSTDLVFIVVNGNGLSEANSMKLFDKDKFKSYLARISQDLGEHVRLGVVGYLGKENMENNNGLEVTNKTFYYGPDATIKISDKFECNLQYLLRNDDEVFPYSHSDNTLRDINTEGALGEIIYSPKGDKSDWYIVGLYNYVASDYNPADYQSATLHFGYLFRRNIRFGLEYTGVFTDTDNPVSRVSLGFTSAF